jgi:hypothetical protein
MFIKQPPFLAPLERITKGYEFEKHKTTIFIHFPDNLISLILNNTLKKNHIITILVSKRDRFNQCLGSFAIEIITLTFNRGGISEHV